MKIKKKKKNYSIWLELKEITFLACIAIIYNQKNKTTHKKIIRVIGNIPEAIIMMIFVCLFLKRIIKKKNEFISSIQYILYVNTNTQQKNSHFSFSQRMFHKRIRNTMKNNMKNNKILYGHLLCIASVDPMIMDTNIMAMIMIIMVHGFWFVQSELK